MHLPLRCCVDASGCGGIGGMLRAAQAVGGCGGVARPAEGADGEVPGSEGYTSCDRGGEGDNINLGEEVCPYLLYGIAECGKNCAGRGGETPDAYWYDNVVRRL